MRKYLLFTTETCKYCPEAKEILNAKGIDYEVVDATTDIENRARYRVMSAPTLVLVDTEQVFIGLDPIKEHLSGLL